MKITELELLEPEELHLVKAGANGFRELLAKAAACPTCKGKGTILAGNRKCPDCAGSGDTTTVEKALACGCDACLWITDAEKAEISGKAQNDLPDAAFAYIESGGTKDADGKTTPRRLRHFPVYDEAHARNALAQAPKSPFGDKAMPKIKAACHKFGIEISAEKDIVIKDDGTIASVMNSNQNGPYPGSAQWEAEDAQTLIDAGQLIAQAGQKLQLMLEREQTEVAVGGKPHDTEDVFDLEDALSALDAVLGITARMAFTEQVEGQVAGMSKAGRRLSGVSIGKVVDARDAALKLHSHLTDLLGDDDPAKQAGNETTAKGVEMELTTEQFDEAVEKKAAEVVAKALADREKAETDATEKAKADKVAKKEAAKKAKTDKAEKRAAKAKAKADADTAKRAAMTDDEKTADDAEKARVAKAKADVKVIRAMAKTAEKTGDTKALEAMAKAIEKGDAVPDEFRKEVDDLRAQIETWANEPQHGGPLLNAFGITPEVRKSLEGLGEFVRGGRPEGDRDAFVKSYDDQIEAAKAAGNPSEADRLSREKAIKIVTRDEISRGYPAKA